MAFEHYLDGKEGDIFVFNKRLYARHAIGFYFIAFTSLLFVSYSLMAKYGLFTAMIILPTTGIFAVAISVYYSHRLTRWENARVIITKNGVAYYKEKSHIFNHSIDGMITSVRTEMDMRKASYCATTAKGYEVDGEGKKRINMTKSGVQITKEITVSKLVIPPYFAKEKEKT